LHLRLSAGPYRLDLTAQGKGLPEIVEGVQEGGTSRKVKGAIEGAAEGTRDKVEGVKEKVASAKEKLPGVG
jgi:hypothetical protein